MFAAKLNNSEQMIRKKFSVNKWSVRALKFGLVLAIIAPVVSCKSDNQVDLVGNWVELSQFEGAKRTDAVAAAVTIGDEEFGFVGLGYNSNLNSDERWLTDFWKYSAINNQWTPITPKFPAIGRNSAVAFSADGKLYVGCGFNSTTNTYYKDFYEYDPATDQWTQIADFPGAGRSGAVAFTINNIGYVGMGKDAVGTYKDFYAYNPTTNSWTSQSEINSYGGNKSADGVAFVISNEAYVCTGLDNTYNNDFYKYNPGENKWIPLAKISDATSDSFDDDYNIVRVNAVAFASEGKGYIATGGKNAAGSDVWEYNPATDRWMEKTSFEGPARFNAVAFTLGDKGYVTTGQNSSYYFDDIWRFDPSVEYSKYD